MISAIKNADNGNGVLCIIGNYGGDVMNLEMACDMVEAEGIKTKKIIVADDIASASEKEKSKRRGIAGMIIVFKVVGAIAESGASLDDIFKIGTELNDTIMQQIKILEHEVLQFLHVFNLKRVNLLLKSKKMK